MKNLAGFASYLAYFFQRPPETPRGGLRTISTGTSLLDHAVAGKASGTLLAQTGETNLQLN